MSKLNALERDCTDKCRSIVHANQIIEALKLPGVSELQLCSYLNYICTNCDLAKDNVGKTALHIASSQGYLQVVRWLIHNRNANINAQEDESGYTPLHRAMYLGRIHTAVELLKAGADTTILDRDGLTYVEHAIQDGVKIDKTYGTLFTWGLNKNNSLGSFSARNTPESFDIFHKKYPQKSVQQMCIDTFHSVIVTRRGAAFSCGHALGGRLGLGTEKTVFEPTEIKFPEKVEVTSVSISRDHSLFLTKGREVYSCGLNTHKVLGITPPPEKCLTPEKIKNLQSKNIIGIDTGRYHSIAWSNEKLYAWGFNGGHLGIDSNHGNYIVGPKETYTYDIKDGGIKKVATSDGATVILTISDKVFLLTNFKFIKIIKRGTAFSKITHVAVTGGKSKLNSSEEGVTESPQEVKVVVLADGLLFVWRENDPLLCCLIFSIPRFLPVKYVTINNNEILFLTDRGECYRGIIGKRKKYVFSYETLNYTPGSVTVEITKVPKIYRAISVVSDPKGENFCVLQQVPRSGNACRDRLRPEIETHLYQFLEDTTHADQIHDVLIRIDDRLIPAHKYILASGSNLMDYVDDDDVIQLEDVDQGIFQLLLIYIYTGGCCLLNGYQCPPHLLKYCVDSDGPCKEYISSKTPHNPIRLLQVMAQRFGCRKLYLTLKTHFMQSIFIFRDHSLVVKPKVFKRSKFPELYDVSLKCSDGVEIRAHKCIVIARCEYFRMLFAARWSGETRQIIDMAYPGSIVESFVDFLYVDSEILLMEKDLEFLLKLLVLADEYLADQLIECCSYIILYREYLDFKNALGVLLIARQVKATLLMEGVIEFIVLNMAYFLENKLLHDLPDEVLLDLSENYIKIRMLKRRLKNYSFSNETSENIIRIHEKYPVDLNNFEKEKQERNEKKSKRRSRGSRKSMNEKNEQENGEKTDRNVDSLADGIENMVTDERSIHERVSAICSAIKIMENSTDTPDYTNLNRLSLLTDFPSLNSPPEEIHRLSTSPNCGKIKKHKIVRVSQKERMRLSSEGSQTTTEIPKNPWKKIPDISPANSPSDSTFSNILMDERKLKENLVKIQNKQLVHTQIEDKAMMELEKFYNMKEIEDEVITVERIEIGNTASPVWIPGHGSFS